MSKVARIIGTIAAVVATAAAIVSLFVAPELAPLFLKIAAIAGAVSGIANAVAVATQKPPDMKGAVNQVLIGANMAVALSLGMTFVAGQMVYDDSAGTNNIDRTQIFVGSVGGPIEGFQSFLADFNDIPFSASSGGLIAGHATDSWYGGSGGFLFVDSRLGLKPDTALVPYSGRAAFNGWSSSSKLSGMAAWSATMAFDKKGERWSGGIPAWGMVAKWTKTYDPRHDSTYPGGLGAQRWADESTWAYGTAGVGTIAQGESGPLQALAYARGRFHNGEKIVGVGLTEAQINVARFVEAANLCDANGWTSHGTIYEGPGISKWDNLKRICATFGAIPLWSGGMLDLKLSKPVTPLDTITAADLAGDSVTVPAMKSWRDRVNTVIPRYRSATHRWDYVQSDAVTNSTYVTEDGETKTREVQFDLVQDMNQAAQLAAYALVNGREYGPVQLTCKPRLLPFRVGEAVNLDLASLLGDPDLAPQAAIITSRTVDPATGTVRLALESDTAAKHAWALARTGTAPPSPAIRTNAEIDQAALANVAGVGDPPQRLTFKYDYTGTAEAGEFGVGGAGRDLTFNLLDLGGSAIGAGLTWEYALVSGGINGFTSASGAQAMSGTGTGTLNVTSLDSSEAKVLVTATYKGRPFSKQVTLTRDVAGAPISGGGGGGGGGSSGTLVSKSSGFAGFNSTTFTDSSGTLSGTTPAGVTDVDINVALDAFPVDTGAGSVTVQCRVMRDIGGTWTQIGSPQSATSSWGGSSDPASFLFSINDSGLSASTAYDWRVELRDASGSHVHNVSGDGVTITT